MPQQLIQDVVAMLTRRTYATTEAWSPVVGLLLSWLAATLHIGSGASVYITTAAPTVAGFIVAWVAVARKSAAAKWLHDHVEPVVLSNVPAVGTTLADAPAQPPPAPPAAA
jgi:hypothetical protein